MNNPMDGILLTPVLDRNGTWAAIWARHGAGCAHVLKQLCDKSGEMRIVLDAGEIPEGLSSDRLWVAGADEALLQPLAARGYDTGLYGQQFMTNTASEAAFNEAVAQGAAWFSGEFAARPAFNAGNGQDTGRAVLLRLLTLVAQDASGAEIEQAFKHEPGLSFNLLRLVNSVSMGVKTPISSFSQAIMVLGRRQLQRWLQLLLYTSSNDGDAPNPLLQLAAWRGRLMERLVAVAGRDAVVQEHAFMAGIFSLLNTLLNLPMSEIVKIITLPEDVQAALLAREGELGGLLALVDAWQRGAEGELSATMMNIGAEQLAECQLDAVCWAMGVGRMAD